MPFSRPVRLYCIPLKFLKPFQALFPLFSGLSDRHGFSVAFQNPIASVLISQPSRYFLYQFPVQGDTSGFGYSVFAKYVLAVASIVYPRAGIRCFTVFTDSSSDQLTENFSFPVFCPELLQFPVRGISVF
jgi:hypothetical protein